MKTLVASRWFDGERYHANPVTLFIDRGRIVERRDGEHDGPQRLCVAFAMPGLVEAHCHLFLDGAEVDGATRKRYLGASFEVMLGVARANAERARSGGITLVRDAGDRYGVNHALRAESRIPKVRSPGIALRRPARYGAFLAREVASLDEALVAVHEAAASADDLKIIQTGIIDFESGRVKGAPQFDYDTLTAIVRAAHGAGLRTFAHCSGSEGIEIAVRAGVDSIEHGFFMTEAILRRMADQGTAWVPTFSPVHFQWAHPELAPWNRDTVAKLRTIIDAHGDHVARAAQLGVNLVAGSDAGSPGVEHGAGLLAELRRFVECGLSLEQALRSATVTPRRLWGLEPATIAAGALCELALFDADPFVDPSNLDSACIAMCEAE